MKDMEIIEITTTQITMMTKTFTTIQGPNEIFMVPITTDTIMDILITEVIKTMEITITRIILIQETIHTVTMVELHNLHPNITLMKTTSHTQHQARFSL